ncbi:hypothetical protein HMPREF0307_00325 [Corynebacterium sp. DNF00584]|nr:hypothetical protein HMPREF0307_00325 [Corynebacterium sp. DNF00584]
MARMTIARKAALFAATAGLTATLAAPAASADAIDNYLAKVPSGQISCEQAAKYYTNPTDYNNKKRQALAVATFDSRGPQIRNAISRADEAIARCNLANGGTQSNNTTTNNTTTPAPANNQSNTPAPANNNQAPAQNNTRIIPLFVQAGQPTIDVPVPAANVTVRVPNVPQLIQAAIAKVQAGDFANLSSF